MARDLSPTGSSGSDDALALFGAEAAEAKVVSVEDVSKTATLRFVEGVAVVQALTATIKAKGGVSAGMPDLQGAFLTPAGEVIAISPLGSKPAAPELARLLHRMVAADVTPPVGRLFIDRWVSSDSNDLTQFSTELEYFARPNGRELVTSVHARYAAPAESPSTSASAPVAVVPSIPGPDVFRPPTPSQEPEVVPAPEQNAVHAWLLAHRRQLAAAAIIVVSTVVVTAVGAWFWPAKTAAAATAPALASPIPGTDALESEPEKTNASRALTPATSAAAARGSRSVRQAQGAEVAPPTDRLETTADARSTQPSNELTADETPAPVLQSRNGPDLTIYSGNDPGVEAPTLRSAEIPEFVISGFPTRTNWVEVVISSKGDVETVKMVGPPQRLPDIMLLSRVKEWAFAPATKDGRAVRYRLTLSWNVTP